MRARSVVFSIFEVGVLLLAGALPACAKTPPEAKSAPAASSGENAPSKSSGSREGVSDGFDKEAPPGVDLGRLDDFQKKVFFRVVNAEPAICGAAQSLIQSAKKDPHCRRSFNAV